MTMADAVNYLNLPAGMAAYAGYIDGPKSKWPAAGWAKYPDAMTISVLADPSAMAFDVESGNASPSKVTVAVASRKAKGFPSVCYGVQATIRQLAVTWMAPVHWPVPGAYLWAAAGTVGQIPSWCPVTPVAVQDRYLSGYDLSTLYDGWLPVIPARPAPPLTEEELMSLAVSADGSTCYAVGAGNGRTGHLLKVTPGSSPGTFSVIDVTATVSNETGPTTPAFTVSP